MYIIPYSDTIYNSGFKNGLVGSYKNSTYASIPNTLIAFIEFTKNNSIERIKKKLYRK